VASPSTMCADAQNILIEATAVDEHKAAVTVNQIVAAFSYYCKLQFTCAAPPSPSGQWEKFVSMVRFYIQKVFFAASMQAFVPVQK